MYVGILDVCDSFPEINFRCQRKYTKQKLHVIRRKAINCEYLTMLKDFFIIKCI